MLAFVFLDSMRLYVCVVVMVYVSADIDGDACAVVCDDV